MREKLVEMSEQLRYCAYVSDCANCKRWDKVCENKCVDNLLLMAADMIDSVGNGVTVQKWIPVTERMPEEDELVLCVGAKGGMFLGYPRIMSHEGTAYTIVPNARGGRYTKYWMPLPEPPKGE